MKSLELLLREHVKDLGRCGDVVRVAPGFARNYLLPRNLAVATTPENLKVVARRKARLEVQEALDAKEAGERAAALGKVELKTTEKTDAKGRLYGSVSAARIAELLSDAGYTVDVKDIRLESPIKQAGEHIVPLHIAGDLMTEIKVQVEGTAVAS
ncbi:MAG: large subunit ribosomal protein L9 [Chlamydiales bacterium]|jgi:large subunit ribosomal protein L9